MLSLVLFLLAILLIWSLINGRKIKDIQEYALGNKIGYSFSEISTGYLSVFFSSSTLFRLITESYIRGICTLSGLISITLGNFIRYLFMGKHIVKYTGCLTLPEVIGLAYGKKARIFSGLIYFLTYITIVSIEIKLLSLILQQFLEIERSTSIILATSFLAIFTSFGGMKAIMSMSIINIIFITIFLFFLSNLLLSKSGGISGIISKTPIENLNFFRPKFWSNTISILFLETIFHSAISNPVASQRLLNTNSVSTIKKIFLATSLSWLLYTVYATIIAFSAYYFGNYFSPTEILISLIQINIDEGIIKYTIILCMIGFCIISTSGQLHSCGLLLYRDFISSFFKSEGESIFIARILTIISSFICIWIAEFKFTFLDFENILSVITCTISFPIVIIFLGIRPSKIAFWTGVVCGLSSLMIFNLCNFNFFDFKNNAKIASGFVNIVAFSIVSIAEAIKLRTSKVDADVKRKQRQINYFSLFLIHFYKLIQYIIKTIKHYLSSANKNLINFQIFGFAYIILVLLNVIILDYNSSIYIKKLLYIKFIVLGMCILLMIHSKWPKLFIRYLPIFWYITLGYCLPFYSTIFLITSGGSTECIILLTMNLMILILLVDWARAIIISIIGVIVGIYYADSMIIYSLGHTTKISNYDVYIISYQAIISLITGVILAKKRQSSIDIIDWKKKFNEILLKQQNKRMLELENSKDTYIKLLGQDECNVVEKIEAIIPHLDNYTTDQLKNYFNEIAAELRILIDKSTEFYKLYAEKISVKDFAEEVKSIFLTNSNKNVKITITSNKEYLNCDLIAIFRILSHLLSSYYSKSLEFFKTYNRDINIYISDCKITYFIEGLKSYKKVVEGINITFSSLDYLSKDILESNYRLKINNAKDILPIEEYDLSENSINKTLHAHFAKIIEIKKPSDVITVLTMPRNIYSIRKPTLDNSDSIIDTAKLRKIENNNNLEKIFLELIYKETLITNKNDIEKAVKLIKNCSNDVKTESDKNLFEKSIHLALIILRLIQNKELDKIEDLEIGYNEILLYALLHNMSRSKYFCPLDVYNTYGAQITEQFLSVNELLTNNCFYLLKKVNYKYCNQNISIITSAIIKSAKKLCDLIDLDDNAKDRKTRVDFAKNCFSNYVEVCIRLELDSLAKEFKDACIYVLTNQEIEGHKFNEWFLLSPKNYKNEQRY